MELDEGKPPPSQWAADLASAALTLARRAAAGATLWCWAPEWPQHAEHVAVEFVHPVVVGARALPAEAVSGPDPAAELRAVVASGDVLVVVSDAGVGAVRDVLRRAPAWGLETIWIGTGPRPAREAATHLVWLDEEPDGAPGAVAAFDGTVVLSYHVLWELTHVCFEHPGILRQPGAAEECADEVRCITCADEGRLGEVVEAPGTSSSMRVRTQSGLEDVDASLVEPVAPGDLVLVHAGVAISRIGEDER